MKPVPHPSGVAVLLSAIAFAASLVAEPVTELTAAQAASAFISRHYSTNKTERGRIAVAAPRQAGVAVPLRKDGATLGYIVPLAPDGFLLVRPDDDMPPVKLHSPNGSYPGLPPDFRAIVEWELEGELASLRILEKTGSKAPPAFREAWKSLLDERPLAVPAKDSGSVLIETRWGQSSPYNNHAPALAGNRVPAGCGSVALAQILRYHRSPAAPLMDFGYTDTAGDFTGAYNLSDAGLSRYDWDNMPVSLTADSPRDQQEEVARLLYQAGVALRSDYEAQGTTTTTLNAMVALGPIFGFTYAGVMEKEAGQPDAWYGLIAAEIDAGRPLFYAMWQADGSTGHAVVCDGYRNGNEIHLNLGWSGRYDAWYTIESVTIGVLAWTIHEAIYGIAPSSEAPDPTVPGSLSLVSAACSGREGGYCRVRVRRSGGSAGAASVAYSAIPRSAHEREDFIPQAGILTWADGDAKVREIRVAIPRDGLPEGDELFAVVFRNAAGAGWTGSRRARVTVRDGD